MRSKARVLGHPIHPMLVVLPLGLFPVALLFDVVFALGGGAFWYLAAFWLLAIGLAGALAAAIPGLVDYVLVVRGSGEAPERTGTRHLVNGFLVLAVFAFATVLHALDLAPERAPWLAIGANALGNLLLVYQGYTGGSLTYKHAIGVDRGPSAPPGRGDRAGRERPGA